MSTLKEEIKNKTFKNLYLIYGDDQSLRSNTVKNLIAALTGGDTMNYLSHTGDNADLSALRDFTDTVPFFAERRVAYLEDTGLFKAASDGFSEWLESIPDTAVVVFSESEIDKRNKLYKMALKDGTVEECAHPTPEILGKWVLRKVGAAGKNITENAYALFMSSCKADYAFAGNELEKLLSYTLHDDVITEEAVRAVCTPSLEDHIFNLVEAVSEGKRETVLKYYYELIALREAPLKILALTGKEFLRLSAAKEMLRQGMSDADIAANASINPKILWKYKKQCGRFSDDRLKKGVALAVETEKSVKSGNITDRLGTEIYLMKMTDR